MQAIILLLYICSELRTLFPCFLTSTPIRQFNTLLTQGNLNGVEHNESPNYCRYVK